MPKISVRDNIKQNPEALYEFKKSEKESKQQMDNLLKKVKKDGNPNKKINKDNEEFKMHPERLRNWTFFGKENLPHETAGQ